MKVLFPQNPMMKKLPEPIFEHEFDAAQSLGLSCLLFAEEVMSREGAEQSVKQLPDGDGGPLLYSTAAGSLPRLSTATFVAHYWHAVTASSVLPNNTPRSLTSPTTIRRFASCRRKRSGRTRPIRISRGARVASWETVLSYSKITSNPRSIFGMKPVSYPRGRGVNISNPSHKLY